MPLDVHTQALAEFHCAFVDALDGGLHLTPALVSAAAQARALLKVPMGTKAIDAPTMSIFLVDPEELTLIGRDTKDGDGHALYDPRAKEKFDEHFVQSIINKGVLKPIIIKKVDEELQVVDGRRRVINAREANVRLGLDGSSEYKVPCILEKGSDEDLFEVMVAANCFQKVPSPIENMKMVRRFLSFAGKTEKDAAEVFGVDVKTIGNWLKLDALDTTVQKAVEAGEVSATAATKLVRLPPKKQKAKLAEAKKATPKGKKVKVATVAKKTGTNNLAFKAPSKKLVKKLQDWESEEISNDFILGAGWATGAVPTTKVKGLSAFLKQVEADEG